ncbi:Assimilatory sulfite reductase (NADPH) flavoprotein subunit [Balamuthia mandrillaris]
MSETLSLLSLYGSQTGNAESISQGIHLHIAEHLPSFQPQWRALKDWEQTKLCDKASNLVVLFVVSSTGQGDPPDNALPFWRWLRARKHSPDLLSHVRYTLLGIGDTNYDTFQGFPRKLEKRLEQLGAKPFYEKLEADEATGALEDAIEPWKEGLWDALSHFTASSSSATGQHNETPVATSTSTKSDGEAAPQQTKGEEASESAPAATKRTSGKAGAPRRVIKQKLYPDLPPCHFAVEFCSAEAPPSGSVAGNAEGGQAITTCDANKPFLARLSSARCLTAPGALKTTLEVTLDVSEGNEKGTLSWVPGDAFAIQCPNPEELVAPLIDRLGLSAQQMFILKPTKDIPDAVPKHIPSPCSVEDCFSKHCDILSLPKKSFLRMLAEYTIDPAEKERLMLLCGLKGKDEYRTYVEAEKPSLLDLLQEFPSCSPPLAHLLATLPPQQPRYYSIACSPFVSPHHIRFAFNIVQWQTPSNKTKHGLCTTWLKRLCKEHLGLFADDQSDLSTKLKGLTLAQSSSSCHLPIYMRPTREFIYPEDRSKPLVMVGPGTGVAPFLGFLQHRKYLLEQASTNERFGPCWLFFGCRNELKDFIYRNELEEMKQANVLTFLSTAFSRDTEEVVYVQHRMEEHSKELYQMLAKEEGFLFICGDANNMAKGVTTAVQNIFQKEGGMSAAEAQLQQANMMKQGRIQMDVWA